MSDSIISRDTVFYVEQVVFLVEDTLFKVPRRPFEERSEVFRDMFSLPSVGLTADPEGHSDEHPIRLEGVKADDFRALLKYMFPQWATSHSRTLSATEWVSILKLSRMWSMTKSQTSAIQKLESLLGEDPIRRILLAKEYDIQNWLSRAYVQLASRKEPLNAKDAASLGYECAFKIVEVRERAYEIMFTKLCGDCTRRVASFTDPQANRRRYFLEPQYPAFEEVIEREPKKHPITIVNLTELVKEVFGM